MAALRSARSGAPPARRTPALGMPAAQLATSPPWRASVRTPGRTWPARCRLLLPRPRRVPRGGSRVPSPVPRPRPHLLGKACPP
eukprot:9482149-Alexandrium_andersonii.AAC.1